jgi:hypothetical protein
MVDSRFWLLGFVLLLSSKVAHLLACGYQGGVAVTENDGGQRRSRGMIGATDLRDRFVQLVLSQEMNLVGSPPTADAGASPLVPIEVQSAEAPAGPSSGTMVVGHNQSLVSEAIALLGGAIARELDGKAVLVFDDRCTCFFAHV